ncbi:MAG: glycoside hydrolase family 15 protein, partial [Pseudomonadota bacterium]
MSNYKPIEDYALIGDCHGAALVARNGDIDWCALGRFDAEPMLFPILDSKRGGAWSIAIEGSTVSRAYEPASNILRTVFETAGGTVEVLDFMPVGRRADAGAFDYVTLSCVGWVVRRVRVLSGEVDLTMTFRPGGPNWDRVAGRIALKGHEALLERADTPERCAAFYADGPLSLDEDAKTLTSREKLTKGDVRHYILTAAPETSDPFARVEELRAITHAFWTEWADFCRYDGPHREQVLRSALALKLLTYAPTGAIVAAATTSLPEEIGGERNWDYRYCWIRDSALTLYALSAIGYSGEGRQFSRFLMGQPLPRFTPLQIMYGVHGERALLEENLTHLEGYKGSAPVRIGNSAHDQLQLDVYGEMLDLAQIRVRLGAKLNPRERTLLSDAA